jgi:hypothetical protein
MEAIVKIDKEGRVKLPSTILDALHVATPGELRAHASTGKLELTPLQTPSAVTFINENGILVAANTVEFDAVTATHPW